MGRLGSKLKGTGRNLAELARRLPFLPPSPLLSSTVTSFPSLPPPFSPLHPQRFSEMASSLTRRLASAQRSSSLFLSLSSPSLPRAALLARSTSTLSSSTLPRISRLSPLSLSSLGSRRSASSKAGAAEGEDGEEAKEEPIWPERILPVMTEADVKFSSRQRNVGM